MRLKGISRWAVSALLLSGTSLVDAATITQTVNGLGLYGAAFPSIFQQNPAATGSPTNDQFPQISTTNLYYDGNPQAAGNRCDSYENSANCVASSTSASAGSPVFSAQPMFSNALQSAFNFAMIAGCTPYPNCSGVSNTVQTPGSSAISFAAAATPSSLYSPVNSLSALMRASSPFSILPSYFSYQSAAPLFSQVELPPPASNLVVVNAITAAAVPEPSTLVLFGFGFLALVVFARRYRSA